MTYVCSRLLLGSPKVPLANLGPHDRLQLVRSLANFDRVALNCSPFFRVKHGNRNMVRIVHCYGLGRESTAACRIVGRPVEEDERQKSPGRSAADETLDMLDWPRLCAAVAGFASTDLGKRSCHVLTLPLTKEESQALLDETSAGLEIDCLLGGLLDFGVLRTQAIREGLDRACKGIVIQGQELATIAMLLQVAHKLQHGVASLVKDHEGRQASLQPIAKLVEPMIIPQDLSKLIWSKIDEDGTVRDTASAQVRQARIQARTLEQRLQELMDKLVRENQAAEDAQEVIAVDGRLCLMVSTAKANPIPGLLFQRSGGLTYLEPSQAVPLNNKLAEARAEVQKAEYDVLSGISMKLVPHLHDVNYVLYTIVRLDMIAARGKYSSWIGGRKPLFIDIGISDGSNKELDHQGPVNEGGNFKVNQDNRLLIQLRKARHPLLVEQHYHTVRKAKAKLKAQVKLLSRMRTRVGTTATNLQSSEAEVAALEAEVSAMEARAPVPIDVRISRETRVVAITGPNTGGKTAAIKTVGLAILMAKVGLYVLAMDPVYIPWFNAVFADIGDEQSLDQSLSTFSGHLRRIKRIKVESTGDSLVLLDEVGAGTDPTEGAALGMALLESFAQNGTGGSLLTLATTHHGELKTLKYSDSRFENASVEFDEERLAPTYKLLWGIPGRSNALNIARRLGLSDAILADAQRMYGAANAELNEVIMTLEEAKLDFDRDHEESEVLTLEAKDFHSQLLAAAERVYEHKNTLQAEKCEKLAAIAGAARSTLSAIARKQNPKLTQSVEARTASTDDQRNSQKVLRAGQMTRMQLEPLKDIVLPNIGQLVHIPKLGRDVKVVAVDTVRKEITVQSGSLHVKIGLKDLL